jgi:uncharacterized membrane protein
LNEVLYYTAALSAAFCWSAGSLIARKPVKEMGEISFVTLRMVLSYVLLRAYCYIAGIDIFLSSNQITWIVLSGVIGISLGDICLFSCLRRIGVRKAQLIFSFHAPFTALLAYFIYTERWTFYQFIGTSLVFVGVLIAIFSKKTDAMYENLPLQKMWTPILLGLLAALSQAIGVLLIKPVFQEAGTDAISVATFRIGVAALALVVFSLRQGIFEWKKLNFNVLVHTLGNGSLSMVLGMTLIVFALSGGEAGIVATLSATAPVVILPMMWIIDKKRPSLLAFFGAVLVVVGCYFLFIK